MTTSSHAASLNQKHAQLEEMIAIERQRPFPDALRMQQLKKKKLLLKEELAELTKH